MKIEQAVAIIIGDKLARSIIDDMGIHWAIVVAMAGAKTSDDPRAIAAIREWNAEQKRAASPAPPSTGGTDND